MVSIESENWIDIFPHKTFGNSFHISFKNSWGVLQTGHFDYKKFPNQTQISEQSCKVCCKLTNVHMIEVHGNHK